jgi:molybdopterin converting factor subunit 1
MSATNPMHVEVKLFALARQLAGAETATVLLPPGATVLELKGALAEGYPPLADLLRHTRFAINADYASDATPIPAGAEIACIPPVSGG